MTLITKIIFIQVRFFEVRIFRRVFKLIKKNAIDIDNVSDCGT